MATYQTSERPQIIDQLRTEGRGLPYRPAKRRNSERSRPSAEDSRRLFTVENGNRWLELARREPEAKMLFGELWHQNELCMLFADTNIGKSVLAVQLGENIARGQSTGPFACQAEPASVLYIDFELSKSQFGFRYSQGEEDHLFSDNFYRAQYNFIPDPPPNVDETELLIAAIEYKINLVKATVLIIDNVTCLRGGTENSTVALSIMKSLKALKTDYQLSVLVLAHTPKRRNPTQPITADDLHGSKLLVNFADSAFAIGKSTAETDLCYLKQIKQRNTRQRYGEDNVCLCRMQKPGTFLHFAFEGNSAERLHLLTRTAIQRQHLADQVAALAAAGFSQREISRELNIGLGTVNKMLRQCEDVGEFADGQMTNDVMTNDQNGCADVDEREDMRMGGHADVEIIDGERYADEVSTADEAFPVVKVMENTESESIYTVENDLDENSISGEDGVQWAFIEEEITGHTPTTHTLNDDMQMATPGANTSSARIFTTSEIDMLLTPELLQQIELAAREDLGGKRGINDDEQPNGEEGNSGP